MNTLEPKENIVFTLNDVEKITEKLYSVKNKYKIYTFSGPLGAGKTTLVKSLLKQFDVHVPITSPTFSYLNVYENNKGELLYHFDLYRLKNLQEFLEPGFDEFLYLDNSWAFIEWPEVIHPLLKNNVCALLVDFVQDNQRKISFS